MTTPLIRVLVCDDELGDPSSLLEDDIRSQLDEAGLLSKVDIEFASNIRDAVETVNSKFFDIAFVDLFLDASTAQPIGTQLMTHIRDRAPGCLKVLSTSFSSDSYRHVISNMTASRGGKTFLMNKLDSTSASYAGIIEELFAERLAAHWSFELGDNLVSAVVSKTKRIDGLRSNREAISDELHALMFSLFNEMASFPLARSSVAVDLQLMSSQGLTSSVVAVARTSYGEDQSGDQIVSNRCVVKIGKRSDIAAEARRFNRLVKLCVPSEFRVELLSTSVSDALGAVCYSFAGGTHSENIASLDDWIIEEPEADAISRVLTTLFSAAANNWSLISGPDASLSGWYTASFGRNFGNAVEEIDKFLDKRHAWSWNADRRKVSVEGLSFVVPSARDMGYQRVKGSVPTFLIHGDLHGGNVLLADGQRVSLIDYATAGFGPRFADAAAMGSSLRLIELTNENSEAAMAAAARSYQLETVLCGLGSDTAYAKGLENRWFSRAAHLQRESTSAVGSLDPDASPADLLVELIRTQLVYAVSIFGLPHWNRVQRLRIVAWMSANLFALTTTRSRVPR